jgi:hypothetical protein
MVWAADEMTGEQSLRRVVRTMPNVATAVVLVHAGREVIAATPDRPFWVEDQ